MRQVRYPELSDSLLNAIIILSHNFDMSQKYTLGNILAVLCSVCLAISFIIAEKVRQTENTIVYTRTLYLTAAATLLIIAVITDSNLASITHYADVAGVYQNSVAPYSIPSSALGALSTTSNYSVTVHFSFCREDSQCAENVTFTIDNAHRDHSYIDTNFSEHDPEHKSFNVIRLDNGQFAAQPNNRVIWGASAPHFFYRESKWLKERKTTLVRCLLLICDN